MTVKKKVPERHFDLLSELLSVERRAERKIPLLKIEDILRDRTKTTPVSMH